MATMVIPLKIIKNVCINAHPVGCHKFVESQIQYVQSQGRLQNGPKNVLVIGGSAGYGLASRIVSAYGYGAKTINVAYEFPAFLEKKRTASVGWYNTQAFESIAQADGLWVSSIFGDAFSNEIKSQTIDMIKKELGTIDMIVYSLASGKRMDPSTGTMYTSVLKPIGNDYSAKSLDIAEGKIIDVTVPQATEEEIAHTIKVMGGEDWKLWIDALMDASVIAENAITVAYSYIGPQLTYPLYYEGTIGKAKEDLANTAHDIDKKMQSSGIGRAYISVNKALATRASMVIPVVPLYLSILYKIMKDAGIHETCIEQMYRLCKDKVYNGHAVKTDFNHYIRLDDWEMRDSIQEKVLSVWNEINESNLHQYADVEGFRNEFLNLHGFGWSDIDYSHEIEI